MSWTPQTKNSTSFSNQSKNSASYTNQSKTAYGDSLLMEDSSYLLLETGCKILLEQSTTTYIPSWTNQTKN